MVPAGEFLGLPRGVYGGMGVIGTLTLAPMSVGDAATLLLLALRGLRPTAAAEHCAGSPLEEEGQVLIVGTRTFVLAACLPGSQGSESDATLQRSAHRRRSLLRATASPCVFCRPRVARSSGKASPHQPQVGFTPRQLN